MQFDPTNNIVKLCAEGMILEGNGNQEEAYKLFQRAWNEATNDFEKFTSAHYVARHQKSVNDKLTWDTVALNIGLKINDENIKSSYPSLYLNVAKCYEDLGDFDQARENYDLALSFTNLLPDDGYGKMIKSGIANGIERIKKQLY
jgi:tetratricopeptide (TPR) repeat protein